MFAICAIIFVAGLARGEDVALMFLTAVSLAVAAIPEALPATVTISLAIGARKMAERNALVRRLAAVETLGSVTFICSDKTGTLTRTRCRSRRSSSPTPAGARRLAKAEPADALFAAIALNNHAHRAEDGTWVGDPTEVALKQAAAAYAPLPAFAAARRIRLRLRAEAHDHGASRRRRVGRLCQGRAGSRADAAARHVLAAGAGETARPGALARRCREMAGEGLRVLAVAERRFPDWAEEEAEAVERDLTLLGLVGMIDPPRPEVVAAVATCRAAGIVPVMITGDHPATARTIARRLGILDGGTVVTGSELAGMSDDELQARVLDVRVYARVDPAQKIRVVAALQAAGAFVAMTGDGVNDAPALRRANIGIAMGRIGTDVAREASGLRSPRRQLRHHRRRGARGPAHLRQPPQGHPLHHDRQFG